MRDIGKSNRLRYLLDSPWKYLVVQPGTVISLGLTEDVELIIEKIGYSSGSISFSDENYHQMNSLLNTDRINYLGEVDPTVPLKTIVDFDFR